MLTPGVKKKEESALIAQKNTLRRMLDGTEDRPDSETLNLFNFFINVDVYNVYHGSKLKEWLDSQTLPSPSDR
jgi:hypothetical protein